MCPVETAVEAWRDIIGGIDFAQDCGGAYPLQPGQVAAEGGAVAKEKGVAGDVKMGDDSSMDDEEEGNDKV